MRHERNIVNFTRRKAILLPGIHQADLLIRQTFRQWRHHVLTQQAAYRIDDNYDDNGEYRGPPRKTIQDCYDMVPDDNRLILPILVRAVFDELNQIRRDCTIEETEFPENMNHLNLYTVIWSLISVTDEASRAQFPTPKMYEKFKNIIRYPDGHETTQTVEEYYTRNFGSWFKAGVATLC